MAVLKACAYSDSPMATARRAVSFLSPAMVPNAPPEALAMLLISPNAAVACVKVSQHAAANSLVNSRLTALLSRRSSAELTSATSNWPQYCLLHQQWTRLRDLMTHPMAAVNKMTSCFQVGVSVSNVQRHAKPIVMTSMQKLMILR